MAERAESENERLVQSLRRCVQSLDAFIADTLDPGTEALGAVYEAKTLLSHFGGPT